MLRAKTVPVLVFVLGLLAMAALVFMQQRADGARTAQIDLERVKLSFIEVQRLAFQADDADPREAAAGRARSKSQKQSIARTLEALKDGSPPAELDSVTAQLDGLYVTFAVLMRMGETPGPADPRSGPDRGATFGRGQKVEALLQRAGAAYDRRAERARLQTTVGGICVIAILLAAFGFFYRRSVTARRLAEDFAGENTRLLAASRKEALIDALTGLRNRRALENDLTASVDELAPGSSLTFALYDLDGFKQYNDTFGHPAGDALLTRLGANLRAAIGEAGSTYRMGGDEFCLLTDRPELVRAAATALSERGDSFTIGCSYGEARLPAEATSAEQALKLADQRMYEQKNGRSSASRQSTDVLLTVLSERNIELSGHLTDVGELARLSAERAGLPDHEVMRIQLAAELHDVGKSALPETLLAKHGALSPEEWGFVREHTVIGERIVRAAPSLAHTADLVRASHERYDGHGYPDGLRGAAIPLGASIIAVCDAYDVMTSPCSYRETIPIPEALAELRRSAGTQFDPAVVEAFCVMMAERTVPLRA